MSTRQNTQLSRHRLKTGPGTGVFAVSALIAIGVSILTLGQDAYGLAAAERAMTGPTGPSTAASAGTSPPTSASPRSRPPSNRPQLSSRPSPAVPTT